MRLRNAMLSSAIQQSTTLLLYFATGIAIAHLLSPREAGSYSIAIASVNVVGSLKDEAFGMYVVSAPKFDNALLKTAFALSITFAICLGAGFLILSFPLAVFYHDPILGESLRILALAQLGPGLAFPATMRLMRAMRFGSLLTIGLTAALSQSFISITLAAHGYGARALAWGYLTSALVVAALTIACQPDVLRLRPTFAGARQLLAFGAWNCGMLLVGNAASSAPELIVGRAFGVANAALFSRAQNLVSFVRTGMFGALRPVLPSLGERATEGALLAPIYLRIVETITGLAWPAYAVLAVWAEPLVRAIYGAPWSGAGRMMVPIAIAHGVMFAAAAQHDFLIAQRRQRVLFACEFAFLLFTVLGFAIGLTISISAAVWSLVASAAFSATCYVLVLNAVIELPLDRLVKSWSRSLTLTLAVIPVPLVFRHFASDGLATTLLGFAGSASISGLIWIGTLIFIGHDLSHHLDPLLRAGFAALASRRLPWRLAAVKREQ